MGDEHGRSGRGGVAQRIPLGIAGYLRARREKLKLPQKWVAVVAGVSRGTLINLEKDNPHTPQPGPETVIAVAAALGVMIPEVIDWTTQPLPHAPRYVEVLDDNDACSRIVNAIAEASVADPVAADQAANCYRAFIEAFAISQPTAMARAILEAVDGLKEHLVPLLEEQSTLDRAIKQYFLQWGEGEELARLAKADLITPHGFASPTAGSTEAFLRSSGGIEAPILGGNLEDFKLSQPHSHNLRDHLEDKLKHAEQALEEAQRKRAELEAGLEGAKRDLERLTKIQADVEAFGRLPENIREMLREGQVVDWKLIKGPRLNHVRIAIREGAEPITAQDVIQEAVSVDLPMILSKMFIDSLHRHNWNLDKAVQEFPAHLQAFGEQTTAALAWLENPQVHLKTNDTEGGE